MPNEPIPIIFDTDMETDCDDAGALCLLHNFQTSGLCEIVGAIGDAHSDYVAPAIQTINSWYGRPDIPVGTVKIPNYQEDPTYTEYRAAVERFEGQFPKRLYNRALPADTEYQSLTMDDYPDAVEVYRTVLAGAQDLSVVICVVGFMTGLAALLRSPEDHLSDLKGIELIEQKVSHVVSMAIVSPCPGRGNGNFNFRMDLPAAQYVVDNLPVPLFLSSWGTSITTGERLMREADPDHPGRKAYELYLDPETLSPPEGNRSSWDQVASAFAVLGRGDLFDVVRGWTLTTDGDEFEWTKTDRTRADGFIIPKSEKRLEGQIEAWMLSPPDLDEIL